MGRDERGGQGSEVIGAGEQREKKRRGYKDSDLERIYEGTAIQPAAAGNSFIWKRPARRLLVEFFKLAVEDYEAERRRGLFMGPVVRRYEIKRPWTAHEWLACDDHDWPFSFVNVCETLDLEPGRVRRLLAQGAGGELKRALAA